LAGAGCLGASVRLGGPDGFEAAGFAPTAPFAAAGASFFLSFLIPNLLRILPNIPMMNPFYI
jgi:hypothetical protein